MLFRKSDRKLLALVARQQGYILEEVRSRDERLHDRLRYLRDLLEDNQRQLKRLERLMTIDFSQVQADLARNSSVVDSTKALLSDLRTKLGDALAANNNADIVAAVQEIHAKLSAQSDDLAAAVAAGTPAAPSAQPAAQPSP